MSSASELLRRLKTAGIVVDVDAGDLVVHPASRVPPELLPEIRDHKEELMSCLLGQKAASLDSEYFQQELYPCSQATEDAAALGRLLIDDPGIGLAAIRARAAAAGIEEKRFALGLFHLPPPYAVPSPRKEAHRRTNDQLDRLFRGGEPGERK